MKVDGYQQLTLAKSKVDIDHCILVDLNIRNYHHTRIQNEVYFLFHFFYCHLPHWKCLFSFL